VFWQLARSLGPVWLSASFLLCSASAAFGQALEYDVKAAFLLNFTKFIEWPPSAFPGSSAPFAICILGKDPFGGALDAVVAGETVNGHPLIVRRLTEKPPAQSCQILYTGEPVKEAAQTLGSVGPGMLTVGEGDAFLRGGGMVAFVTENRRVRFDINRSAAEAAGLKLSSRLLNVARSVQK